jgi:plastocyanin
MWQHPPVNRALGRVLLPLAALAVVAAPILAAAPAMAADGNVSIVDFAFQPADVTIALNEKVTWFNQSPDNHTVTSDTQTFDSGSLPPYGGGYQLIFQRSGTFPYHCAFHPQMKGVIRVGTSGGGPPPPVTTTPRPPTTARPGGTTTSTLATTVLPPPTGGATTTSTTPLAGSVTTTSSTSSTTSTTSLFSAPTTRKNVASGNKNGDDRTKRRWFGAIAAALAAAGTLATIFVARRPAGPPQYDAPAGWGGPPGY